MLYELIWGSLVILFFELYICYNLLVIHGIIYLVDKQIEGIEDDF